ncbi:MAG: tRNA (adenosine(37)-N6)-dimethylallyltransferase MiaA [Pseudomonadota bacterium]
MTPLLVAGPTASGKSAYALAEAAKGGVVINADASQVYDGWRVLTARPSAEEEAQAPHRLYGHVEPAVRFSVGDWLRDLAKALEECRDVGLRPIIVGGTGLYFKAALEGLAEIPPPPDDVRRAVDARLKGEGLASLVAELAARDPDTAAATDLKNPMRVTRALEVLEHTGRGLASWRADTPPPLIAEPEKILIATEREALYARCDARFDAMLGAGALEEARAMAARGLDPILPAMKAVGAPELFAHLRGEMSLEAAAAFAKQATRNYAKRQMTWMRNQMKDWRPVEVG